MTEEARADLAAAFECWRRRQRLSIAEVIRASGVARNTINLIQRGRTKRPEAATLAALARGLATDPYPPHEVDHQIAEQIERELRAMAGYPDPHDPERPLPESLVELGLFAATNSLPKALAWARLVRRARELSPDEIDTLDAPPEDARNRPQRVD